MQLWPLLVGCLLATVQVAGAAGRSEEPVAPLPSQQRVFGALNSVLSGPWVTGDWALRGFLETGKGKARVVAPFEIFGGWTQVEGRWQRVRMNGGKQWLIKGNLAPQVWNIKAEDKTIRELTAAEKAQPMADRFSLTWELYTFSFLGWPDRTYTGVEKLRGRWADVVELRGESAAYSRAVVWMDTEFGSPLQAELYDKAGKLNLTVRTVSVQKVGNEWILKRWEALDEKTHSKVAVEVSSVAFAQRWLPSAYTLSGFEPHWPVIAEEAWEELN